MAGGILQWKIGERTVTSLSDGYLQLSLDITTNLDHQVAAELQKAAGRSERPKLTNNGYLLEGDGHAPILIDTGIGPGMGPTSGHLLQSLQMAGTRPDDIHVILLTHLHPDHCFGLLNEQGLPLYRSAKLLIHEAEMAYWMEESNFSMGDAVAQAMASRTREVLHQYAGRIGLFGWDQQVAPGVTSIDLSGHTPGHTGFQIESDGQRLLIWGDIVQLPILQSLRPETGLVPDVDPERSVKTRRRIMAQAEEEGLLVAGMHVEFPGFCRVQRLGDGFNLVPALWVDYI